jgi:hypothetical protein
MSLEFASNTSTYLGPGGPRHRRPPAPDRLLVQVQRALQLVPGVQLDPGLTAGPAPLVLAHHDGPVPDPAKEVLDVVLQEDSEPG